MSRIRPIAALAAALALALGAGGAQALSINYSGLSDQSAASITQVAGPVTVTAQAFGGVANPQGSMTPTGTPGGFTSLGVNIGGVDGFGTRGLGCGTALASQCDLIAPTGEDLLRLAFSQPVILDSFTLAAWEGPDSASWYAWNGSSYSLVGTAGPDSNIFNGYETLTGPFGAPSGSTSWIFIAENSSATSIALRSINFTAVPEPGTALLVALGLGFAASRARRN